MSEKTGIGWTDHTGGPWLICSKVSPGCKNCYAWMLMLQRLFNIIRRAYKLAGLKDWETRDVWGDNAPRVLSKGFWTDIIRIDRAHAKAGTRGKWFPSMIDWLDDMPAGIMDQEGKWLNKDEVLGRFLKVIQDTPNLDWLLLTKRPENFFERLGAVIKSIPSRGNSANAQLADSIFDWAGGQNQAPHNVWIGVSVEDQKRADERIPLLLQIPAKVRFLSVEPLLEAIQFDDEWLSRKVGTNSGIHWGIVGGESGGNRRDCGVDAICGVARQFVDTDTPCFVKQDCAFKPGQQGRIPEEIWKLKEFPI